MGVTHQTYLELMMGDERDRQTAEQIAKGVILPDVERA